MKYASRMRVSTSIVSSILILGAYASTIAAAPPTLYHQSSHQSPVRAEADDLLLLPGFGFAPSDVAVYKAIANTAQPLVAPSSVPETSNATEGLAEVVSTADAPYSLTVRLPQVIQNEQSYALWVRNSQGEWSNGIKINDARPLWISPPYVYQTEQLAGLPRHLKIIGRNLQPAVGNTTQVRLTGPQTYTLTAVNDNDPATAIEHYAAIVNLPANIMPGEYAIEVNRDGVSWIPLIDQVLTVKQDPTPQTVFPIENYGSCIPNDGLDDSQCIINAISAAKSAGGGDVFFGLGEWNLINSGRRTGLEDLDGIIVPTGVNLVGAGASSSAIIRDANWRAGTSGSTACFTLLGKNTIRNLTFRDEQVYQPTDTSVQNTIFRLGETHYRANGPNDLTLTEDVIIMNNAFDKPYTAIADGGLPMRRLFITNNEFGAFYIAVAPGGNRYNMDQRFAIDDSIIAYNHFKPGSFYNPPSQGTMATSIGASTRLDFSNNFADGASFDYLNSPTDPKGWRAAFFWHMNNNQERMLVSKNTATCPGDKTGDGEAISYDNNANTFAFNGAKTALSITSNTITVAGPLVTTQNTKDISEVINTYYDKHWIQIGQGPGVGQVRQIVSYTIDPISTNVTFTVSPGWDVLPQVDVSRMSVGREFWQVYTVDNFVDQRQPLCQKTNSFRPKGGLIGLWAQTADSAVEGNRQYDTDGINLQQHYTVANDPACIGCGSGTFFQNFVEIRGNIIDKEYRWDTDCSWSGIRGSIGASPTPTSTPPVLGYGVSISHNTITQADALRGGAISLAVSWHTGPPPYNWRLVENTLIHHNHIRDLAGSPPLNACDHAQSTRVGINLYNPVVWRSVLYANTCDNVAKPLNDLGTSTQRVCSGNVPSNSCECSGLSTDTGITASANATDVEVGDPITYAIVVTNQGPDAATGVTLTQEPGSGVNIDSYVPSQGTCTPETHRCNLGTLASGASTAVTVNGMASALGKAIANFSASRNEPDTTVANDGAVVVVNVVQKADLAVNMIDSPDPVGAGDTLTYTISVTNQGPSDATNVVLQDMLPQSVTLLSAITSQGVCNGALQVSCSLGNIQLAGSATITLDVAPQSIGLITNSTSVSSDEYDPDASNNSATEDTIVIQHGLLGNYYNNSDFTNLAMTRTDPTIDYNWGSGAPSSNMGSNTFSVRWTGFVVAPYTETYTFYTVSDDGIEIYVNSQLVVSDWSNHSARERQGTITLTAGQRTSIEVRYYENNGLSVARMLWSSPSTPKQVVPTAYLQAE